MSFSTSHASNLNDDIYLASLLVHKVFSPPPPKLPKKAVWHSHSYTTVTGDTLAALKPTQVNLQLPPHAAAPAEALYSHLQSPIPPPMTSRFPKLKPSQTRAAKPFYVARKQPPINSDRPPSKAAINAYKAFIQSRNQS